MYGYGQINSKRPVLNDAKFRREVTWRVCSLWQATSRFRTSSAARIRTRGDTARTWPRGDPLDVTTEQWFLIWFPSFMSFVFVRVQCIALTIDLVASTICSATGWINSSNLKQYRKRRMFCRELWQVFVKEFQIEKRLPSVRYGLPINSNIILYTCSPAYYLSNYCIDENRNLKQSVTFLDFIKSHDPNVCVDWMWTHDSHVNIAQPQRQKL